jgi:hypothetical protein
MNAVLRQRWAFVDERVCFSCSHETIHEHDSSNPNPLQPQPAQPRFGRMDLGLDQVEGH